MIRSSLDGAFYVMCQQFDDEVPFGEGEAPSIAGVHDLLCIETWNEWETIEATVELVEEDPTLDPADWEVVERTTWSASGPVKVTDMEFDPGDAPEVLDLGPASYDVVWLARRAGHATTRGQSLPDGVVEQHRVLLLRVTGAAPPRDPRASESTMDDDIDDFLEVLPPGRPRRDD